MHGVWLHPDGGSCEVSRLADGQGFHGLVPLCCVEGQTGDGIGARRRRSGQLGEAFNGAIYPTGAALLGS